MQLRADRLPQPQDQALYSQKHYHIFGLTARRPQYGLLGLLYEELMQWEDEKRMDRGTQGITLAVGFHLLYSSSVQALQHTFAVIFCALGIDKRRVCKAVGVMWGAILVVRSGYISPSQATDRSEGRLRPFSLCVG